MKMMNSKEVVDYVKNKETLKSDKVYYYYYMTHEYDEGNRKTWVKAPYDLETFEIICAFIQYECSEIEQSFSIDHVDVLEVLEKHYDCTGSFLASKQDKKNAEQVDLYANWEIYCGQAAEIQNIKLLHREGMNELFEKFVESFYQAKPEWRPKAM